MDRKPDFFLSAGSIGRHRNWGYVEYFTPKRIYQQTKDAIAKYGTKYVYFGFAKPMRITSIIVKF